MTTLNENLLVLTMAGVLGVQGVWIILNLDWIY